MSASVRLALASDAASLADIRIATPLFTIDQAERLHHDPPLDRDYFVLLIDQHPGLVYVAESHLVVVGYTALRRAAHPAVSACSPIQLWQLYVLPSFHGSGIAAQLMSAATHHALVHQHDVIWLGVSEDNHRGIGFYRKHGFAPLGLFEVGSAGHAHRDVVMSCSLH